MAWLEDVNAVLTRIAAIESTVGQFRLSSRIDAVEKLSSRIDTVQKSVVTLDSRLADVEHWRKTTKHELWGLASRIRHVEDHIGSHRRPALAALDLNAGPAATAAPATEPHNPFAMASHRGPMPETQPMTSRSTFATCDFDQLEHA